MRIRGLPWPTALGLLRPRFARVDRPLRVFLCVCDHYEPAWGRPGRHVEEARVGRWVSEFPRMAGRFADSAGRSPQHTFFYPIEDAEYDDRHIARLAELCRKGFGEVEVHLHHHGETSDQLRALLLTRIETLHGKHGLLAKDASGRITYGFVHGNWALDNSRPDGRWCGVNDEITILRETGCYADFTMPSAPDRCQTTTSNSIYYALDDPLKPKSHDRGIRSQVGLAPPQDGLLMIQGPLALDFADRKWGFLPRLENGDLTGRRPATVERFDLWRKAGVCVAGREDCLFVKLHTHGTQEPNMDMLLGEPMIRFHQGLRLLCEQDPQLRMYYVTAREMAELVHQVENGAKAPVTGDARDGSRGPHGTAPCVPHVPRAT